MARNSAGRDQARARRTYSSPVRERRTAETVERIVVAGAELAHELSSWDWSGLTFRAVAARAGVGERTVYRHFPTERHLHDAIMQRLNQLAGVDYDAVDLENLAEVTGQVFRSLGDYAAGQTTAEPDEATFRDVDVQRRAALLRAVEAEAPAWTRRQREDAAAALDVLWHVPSYERLVGAWGMSTARATATIDWLIRLVVDAVRADDAPRG
jgi:AcrR family transcriptional regulator